MAARVGAFLAVIVLVAGSALTGVALIVYGGCNAIRLRRECAKKLKARGAGTKRAVRAALAAPQWAPVYRSALHVFWGGLALLIGATLFGVSFLGTLIFSALLSR